jgi:hypothetical protein
MLLLLGLLLLAFKESFNDTLLLFWMNQELLIFVRGKLRESLLLPKVRVIEKLIRTAWRYRLIQLRKVVPTVLVGFFIHTFLFLGRCFEELALQNEVIEVLSSWRMGLF